MDAPSSSSSRKRPIDDLDDAKKPTEKRVRFPKGKKVKTAAHEAAAVFSTAATKEDDPEALPVPKDLSDPKLAAKERAARRRGQIATKLVTEEGATDDLANISSAEVTYEEDGTFIDDGIQIEPFNLEQEREEGYFDEAGNFVEYIGDKEDKDAWLDSVEVDPKLAERLSAMPKNDEEEKDLSSDDIGTIKRRIANTLQPGETVLHALKRLKGHSKDRKTKMSAETKIVFDQLTEDAMKLMDNGDYNVYHESQDVFEREAEGYEALARAKNNGDDFDMFADDNDDVAPKLEDKNQTSAPGEGSGSQLSSEEPSEGGSSWAGQSDYLYDDASGYYYSSSLGYYYDPISTLYCSAESGQWYKYDEDSGTYDEVKPEPEPTTAS